MFNLAIWLVEKHHKEALPESMSPYDLWTGALDMIHNAFMAFKYNLRHKKYEDMYNEKLIEEPEHHELNGLYIVKLSNCMICKYSRMILFCYRYVNEKCTHKYADNCNSYRLTDARCLGYYFKNWEHYEHEALEHRKLHRIF
ncbi:MAG: hypothetical protein QJR05_13495 [Thermoanaerobacterium sp.]|nr:hypothetical protein [Thermoanaerobacterium sp.]